MANATGRKPERPWGAAEAREVLRSQGLRYSRPRRVILEYLSEQDRHVSAEALHQALRQRGEVLSLSTVYLNLGVLEGAGLVRGFTGPGGESLYDSNPSEHYHVICTESGEVRDVPPPLIDGQPLGAFLRSYVERVTGWTVDEPEVTLWGRRPGADDLEPSG
jgi:Fur family transcriptional regulator, peroxide stress response regulator